MNQKEKALNELLKQIEKQGISTIKAETSITYSQGKSLQVETVSFITLAMNLKVGRAEKK